MTDRGVQSVTDLLGWREPDDAVDLVVLRAQEHDRRGAPARVATQAPAHFDAVEFWHQDVEHHQVERLRAELNSVPRGEEWLRAITVDLRETGLSSGELQALRGVIQWQMDALKGE